MQVSRPQSNEVQPCSLKRKRVFPLSARVGKPLPARLQLLAEREKDFLRVLLRVVVVGTVRQVPYQFYGF